MACFTSASTNGYSNSQKIFITTFKVMPDQSTKKPSLTAATFFLKLNNVSKLQVSVCILDLFSESYFLQYRFLTVYRIVLHNIAPEFSNVCRNSSKLFSLIFHKVFIIHKGTDSILTFSRSIKACIT